MAITLGAMLAVGVPGTQAATSSPVKLVELSTLGVGPGSQGGAFEFPKGVAVAPNGDVYVADSANNRVETFTADGKFASTFGWNVNLTKIEEPGATQAEKNVCTAASGNTCQSGTSGGQAEQMSFPTGITVDRLTGNVFVQDSGNVRIDDYTADGKLVLMLGGEVNKTKTNEEGASTAQRNICTTVSGDECQAGSQWTTTPIPGAFKFLSSDVVAVGGPEDLLYVGDEERVQKFDSTTGAFEGEIRVPPISAAPESQIRALAIDDSCALHQPSLTESTNPTCKEFDPEYGTLYIATSSQNGSGGHTIRKFAPSGVEVNDGHYPLVLGPRDPSAGSFLILAIAVDAMNRLAVSQGELVGDFVLFGRLYSGSTGRLMTEFNLGRDMDGLAFGANGEFYAAASNDSEVLVDHTVPVAELITLEVPCSPEAERETNLPYDCVLTADVDPWGIGNTEVGFEWGKTPALGERTPPPLHSVLNVGTPGEEEPLTTVATLTVGFLPNETYYFRPFAYDANVNPPESAITGDVSSFVTPYVAPRVGAPVASFTRSFAVDVRGEVNPGNAATEYFLEYASGTSTLNEDCPNGIRAEETQCQANGVQSMPVLSSAKYGGVAFTEEITNLDPATEYHVRVFAESVSRTGAERAHTVGAETSFETTSVAQVHAETGAHSVTSPTEAAISAEIDTAGKPVVYAFEIGVDQGPMTIYNQAFMASVLATTEPVRVETTVIGLQPNTKYLYRIRVQSGAETVWSSPLELKTPPERAVSFSYYEKPPMLVPPAVRFPVITSGCKHGYVRDRSGRCLRRHKKHHHHHHATKR